MPPEQQEPVAVTEVRGQGWPSSRQRTTPFLNLVLALLAVALLLMIGACSRLELKAKSQPALASRLQATAPNGRLQEVPPPGPVLQLQAALASHRPQVQITAPESGRVLGSGPWQLKLRLEDWPIASADQVGLGPHLVVQVDGMPPLRISDWRTGDPTTGQLEVTLPELMPGTHQITVYAARPWGEAVKLPGASAQLLVHRLSPDPLSQPAPGTPRLVTVSPAGLAEAEPVLIDWLLQDAPLQGLRPGDGSWRLRISVNGDSFLVDQNTPVWLKGFHPGSNAVVLELLDGLGDPLNPPFNSAVREVVITPGAARPAWLQPHLNEHDLALLVGQQSKEREPQPADQTGDQPIGDQAISDQAISGQAISGQAGSEQAPGKAVSQATVEQPDALAAMETGEAAIGQPTDTGVDASPVDATATNAAGNTESEGAGNPESVVEPELEAAQQHIEQEAESGKQDTAGQDEHPGVPPAVSPTESAEAASARPPAGRIAPTSRLQGSARELVKDDGSLIQARASGPLRALRDRLQPQADKA